MDNNILNKIKIVSVTKETQNEAKKLILDGLAERFGYLDESLNPDLNDIVENYISKGHFFIIGLYNDKIVCTGALIKEKKEVGKMVRISVHKDFRGRGLGKLIVNELEKIGIKHGYKRINISTEHTWHDAIGLYKSCGYIQYGQDSIDVHLYKNLSK